MTTTALPYVLAEVTVVDVERLSPSFVRVTLGGPAMRGVGVEGATLDQRIKLVLPGASGRLPSLDAPGPDWYSRWAELPDHERPCIRTYTIRDLVGPAEERRMLVDIVLHPGAHGPGSTWAERVREGERVGLVAPRLGTTFGGIEFDPGDARRVLLVADETAVPAVAGILSGLPSRLPVHAFLEVPGRRDLIDLPAPPGVDVVWLPREGATVGARLIPAVRSFVGRDPHIAGRGPVNAGRARRDHARHEPDPEIWETPIYSSSGEDLDEVPGAGNLDGLYVWVAGESGMVTTLRRHLVGDLGLPRRQVAFMGYWREGVAMRS